jgi:hypothetical protein
MLALVLLNTIVSTIILIKLAMMTDVQSSIHSHVKRKQKED